MSKGNETRDRILQQALDLSSEVGLDGLTIGMLARRAEMSKSGLYAHFASKEDLQCRVLDTAAARFVDVVLSRVLKQPRGLPRVKLLFELWLDWATKEWSGGCPFVAAATELDDRPGPVRDRLVGHLRDVTDSIGRAAGIAVEEGHFQGDLDLHQFTYQFWGVLLAYHHFARLMQRGDARARAEQAFAELLKGAGAT